MSYNGSGTFVINSAGTPYVSGTVISSTAANSLNSDLATGLSTAICKDGQSTPTANIGLGGFKITNLGAGTVASDAARLSQVQNSGTTTLISITGTDTITGTVSPTLTAYTAGQVFSFVVAATNTGAVTLNINSLGATAVTRTGAVALVAGDMVTGQVAIVEYDGTRFQLLNGNSFTNLKASGTLGVTGATTLSSTLGVTGAATLSSTLAVTGITTVAAGSAAAPSIISTTGTSDTGEFFPAADTIAWSTAGTERIRITSAGNVGIGNTSPTQKLQVDGAIIIGNFGSNQYLYFDGSTNYVGRNSTSGDIHLAAAGGTNIVFTVAAAEKMRIDSSGNVMVKATTSGGVGFTMATDANGCILTSNVSFVPFDVHIFKNSGTTVGKITINTSTTAYTTSSDYRLKQDIQPMTGALAKISALKPVTYKWKIDNSDGQGFIAHELAEIMPDCVTGKKDATEEQEYEISPAIPAVVDADGNETTSAVEAVKGTRTVPAYQGVDASFLVATLTAAIQEQQAMIEKLTARITALETA